MVQIFFTSDTHYSHRLMAQVRGFKTVEEMDEKLISNWNEDASDEDVIFHLGDLSMSGSTRTCEILDRLRGRKHLVLGNHDKKLSGSVRDRFEWVGHYLELKPGRFNNEDHPPIILSHFPMLIWDKRHYGAWHLHGHCHGSLTESEWDKRLDVGVDPHRFWLVSLAHIRARMDAKGFRPLDHHGRGRE